MIRYIYYRILEIKLNGAMHVPFCIFILLQFIVLSEYSLAGISSDFDELGKVVKPYIGMISSIYFSHNLQVSIYYLR